MFKISSLNTQLRNMQSNLSSRISDVQYDVNNISSEVSRTLEEEASILTMADWSFGAFDEDAKMVEVLCKISPKEYSAETTAAIVYENQEYPLTFENGLYTGSFQVPVFDDAHVQVIRFKDGENVRTQNLEWYISPRSEFIPITYAQFSGSTSYNSGTSSTDVNYDGEILIEIPEKEDWKNIEEITLIECIDDKEINRMKINYDGISERTWCDWKKEVEIPFGSTYKAYVEILDCYDLYHRNTIIIQEFDETGTQVEDWDWWNGAEADIYDADGNPLFVNEY